MPKFNRDVCEVCGEPVIDVSKLPKEIQDKVYKPPVGKNYNVEIDLTPPKSFQGSEPVEIEVGDSDEPDS